MNLRKTLTDDRGNATDPRKKLFLGDIKFSNLCETMLMQEHSAVTTLLPILPIFDFLRDVSQKLFYQTALRRASKQRLSQNANTGVI